MKEEIFQSLRPSFESVLFWREHSEFSDELVEKISFYRNLLEEDIDKFYDQHILFCKRAIFLMGYYGDDRAYEDVFYIFEILSSLEDEIILYSCESYLQKNVSEKFREFLYRGWKKALDEYGDDPTTLFIFELLLKSGSRSSELDSYAKKIIWGDDTFLKIYIADNLDGMDAAHEIKRRLRYIAPMVKYGPNNRFDNSYFDEWIELSDPYLRYSGRGETEEFKDEFIDQEESFLIGLLGHEDERTDKLKDKFFERLQSDEYLEKSKEQIAVREAKLVSEFIDPLPDRVEEWISSPFIDKEQKREFEDFLIEVRVRQNEKLLNKKIGRNEPCPCGSGKKYKKCCIN